MFHNSHPFSQSAADLKGNYTNLIDFVNKICDRIDELEPEIQAFLPENNRRKRLIEDAENLIKKFPDPENRPPFFGIPIGVKDIFNVDGFPTKAGSKLPAKVFAGKEASCVTKLKDAGATISGKTVSTEFAYFQPGPTRNPHNLAHTPGGSSSGSAAAVAAGFCPISLGTQTIGSIIRPASYCGVIGFKPSYGRIPTDGVFPFSPSADQIGFFSQNINEIELVAEVLCENWEQSIIRQRKPILTIPVGKYLQQASEKVLSHFNEQISNLRKNDFIIKEVKFPADIRKINEIHQKLISFEFALVHEELFSKYKNLYSPSSIDLIQRGRKVARKDVDIARKEQIELRTELDKLMLRENIDLFISPSATSTAPRGLNSTGSPSMNLPWTFAGVPTMTIPAGIDKNNLPVGLQFAGSFCNDEKMIKHIGMIEKIFFS